MGSIFDAQPSQLIGNIHNTANAAEPVIGYISAGTRQQKRIYILKAALPQSWQPAYNLGCEIDTAYYYPGYKKLPNKLIPPPGLILGAHLYWVETTVFPNIGQMLYPGRPYAMALAARDTVGYLFTTTNCADCTLKGTTQQPAFWKLP